jgi:uncharacterized membrane protein
VRAIGYLPAEVLMSLKRDFFHPSQIVTTPLPDPIGQSKKIAKIISLLEELRTDLPNLSDRHDPEAEVMQIAADPIEVLETLQESLNRELTSTVERMRSGDDDALPSPSIANQP